jgi:hypothetical protein
LVAYLVSSIFTIFHLSLNLIFHILTDNFPLGGICHGLRSPCLKMFRSDDVMHMLITHYILADVS